MDYKISEFNGFKSFLKMMLEINRMRQNRRIGPGQKTNGIRRTGKLYPHSSTRQQARYGRQDAAGQISFSGK